MDPSAQIEGLEREIATLRRSVRLLHGIANLLRESLELEPACYAMLTGVTAGIGLGFNRAMIFLVDEEDRRTLQGAMAVGPDDGEEADRAWRSIEAEAPDLQALYEAALERRAAPSALDARVRGMRVPIGGDSPIAIGLRRGRLVRGEGGDDLGGLLNLPTAIAAPLRGRDAIRGMLYADNRFTARAPDAAIEHVFSLVADHAGRAVDNAQRYERVARAARTDALTGLGHHGALMGALEHRVCEAHAGDGVLSVAMLDLDDFKSVNDDHGHLVGDALLAALAGRLRSELRAGETPYRYGGEEFMVLMPSVGCGEAWDAGERIRRAIGERSFATSDGHGLAVTCSVGVASLTPGLGALALVEAADEALRRAKAQGKDRVVQAG